MIVKKGEARQDKYNSGTFDGIFLNALLVASAVNTAITSADFLPSDVQVKVNLKRGKDSKTIFQDNLLLLGTFNSLDRGFHEFLNGYDKVYPEAGVAAVKLRTIKLNFGGHIRLNDGDQLIVEINLPSTGVFSAAIDAAASNIEFVASPSVGYEYFTPQTRFEVVNTGTPSQSFSPGNNVTKIMFLNFDKNDLSTEVIATLNLQSDRMDASYTFNQLLALQPGNTDRIPASRYGANLPISSNDPSGRAFRGLDYFPQSLTIFDGDRINNELDNCRVNCSFNGANVASSQNYFGWTTYEATQEQIQAAADRMAKHASEKITKTPTA